MARRIVRVMAAAVLSVAAAAWADDVELRVGEKTLPYFGVTVVEARNGTLTFQSAGNPIVKPIEEIASISIRREEEFNAAEKLAKAGKPAEAVKAYDAALKQAQAGWMKRLVRYRRLQALNEAGMIGRGVAEWLALVDASDSASTVLSLRPGKPAAKGEKSNARAIALLEAKVGTLDAEKQKAYRAAVHDLLLGLYRREGLTAKAEALAKKLVGSGATGPDGTGTPDNGESATRTALQAKLKAAQFLIEQDKAGDALAELTKHRSQFGPGELPRALLLSGRARLALAGGAEADGKRKLLCEAGLDFMRVAVYFPNAAEAGAALYWAGRVNADLGNREAARAAYRAVLSRYLASPAAEEARGELRKLDSSTRSP